MDQLLDYLMTRRTVPAAHLAGAELSPDEITTLLKIASRVPDHGKLAPWRFIVYPKAAGDVIGDFLARRWRDRDSGTSQERLAQEQERFLRGGTIIGVVNCAKDHPKIPVWEQELAVGAVCMNLIHGAYALGYRAQWLTEWYAEDAPAARFLGCREGERFAGFIYIGTTDEPPVERPRPDVDAITSFWGTD